MFAGSDGRGGSSGGVTGCCTIGDQGSFTDNVVAGGGEVARSCLRTKGAQLEVGGSLSGEGGVEVTRGDVGGVRS